MQVSAQWLKDRSVCEEGLDWFLRQPTRERIDVINRLLKEQNPQWANWLICRSLDQPRLVRYAVHAAGEVVPIFEEAHPREFRPRKAIGAANRWLDFPNEKNKIAAWIALAGALDAAKETRSVPAYAVAYSGGAPTAATVQAVTAAKNKPETLSQIFTYGVGLL